MTEKISHRKPTVDWLTVVAIAAIAISLNVGFHEGVHALACITVGGDLMEYSALYESCNSSTTLQAKIVAGSAPTLNLIAGGILWIILRYSKKWASETQFFIWLSMLMNWFYGAGYFIFSGIANIGDWAVVIRGWEPGWLWRLAMIILGVSLYIIFVQAGIKELGKMLGGDPNEQISRAQKLCTLSYVTSIAVVLIAGFFCPYGLLSLPVTAGLLAVLGALSPFIYMLRWFRLKSFGKLDKEPLEIHRKWQWLVASTIIVFTYVIILGRTLYF